MTDIERKTFKKLKKNVLICISIIKIMKMQSKKVHLLL